MGTKIKVQASSGNLPTGRVGSNIIKMITLIMFRRNTSTTSSPRLDRKHLPNDRHLLDRKPTTDILLNINTNKCLSTSTTTRNSNSNINIHRRTITWSSLTPIAIKALEVVIVLTASRAMPVLVDRRVISNIIVEPAVTIATVPTVRRPRMRAAGIITNSTTVFQVQAANSVASRAFILIPL
jgi:hypothetical protein